MNTFYTAEKERGIAGRPLLTKRESRFSWGTRSSTSSVYTRSSTSSCLYQGIDICRVDQVISILLFILGHRQFFVYTRSSAISSFILGHERFLDYTRGEASYSQQWPRCGERFLGRYTPDERFLGRLHVWRLGELDPRFWDDSGQRVPSSRPVSGMSKTVGGRSARLRAAASGGAASNFSRVSGRAASGSG